MDVSPFTIAIDDDQLKDLDRRLQHTRWPDALEGTNWDDGIDLAFLQRLTEYWRTGFDWRAQEARLNTLPQFRAELDGVGIHFIHQPGTGPDPYPLVITHGWPGSGFDMEQIIPLLADPGGHGADPADAFDVVAPSLPGYGFSQRPDRPGFGPHHVADMWLRLMTGLGYQRFAVQGHDWGASVSMWLASRFPDNVAGLHLTFIPGLFRPALGDGQPPLSAEEEEFTATLSAWFAAERGVPPPPVNETADAGLRADRFTRGPGEVDRREDPRLERQRRRRGERVHAGRHLDQHLDLLVHRHHRLFHAVLPREPPPAQSLRSRRACPATTGGGSASAGPAAAPRLGGARLQRDPLDADAPGIPLRRHGGPGIPRQGNTRILPPAPGHRLSVLSDTAHSSRAASGSRAHCLTPWGWSDRSASLGTV